MSNYSPISVNSQRIDSLQHINWGMILAQLTRTMYSAKRPTPTKLFCCCHMCSCSPGFKKSYFPEEDLGGNSNMHHPFILKGWSQPLWKKSLIASASKSIWQGLMPGIMPYKGVHRVPWYHPRRTPHRYPLLGLRKLPCNVPRLPYLDTTPLRTETVDGTKKHQISPSGSLLLYILWFYVHISYKYCSCIV